MNWNERLKQARDAAGLTDTDICATCKVKPSSVHGWMTGKTKNIEAHNLLHVCRLLKVEPDWIIFGQQGRSYEADRRPASAVVTIDASELTQLIVLYARSSDEGRTQLLGLAMDIAKSSELRASGTNQH